MFKSITLSSCLLVLASVSPVLAAPMDEFTGTRADVRGFCSGEGRFLLEGGHFTLCTTPETDVMCRDDKFCASSDLQLALTSGFQQLDESASK